MKISALCPTSTALELGNQYENNATVIEIDVSEWLALYPGADFSITYKRPGEETVYPAAGVALDGTTLKWTVGAAVVAVAGHGSMVVRCVVDGVEKRSAKAYTHVLEGHGAAGTAPEPAVDYIAQFDTAESARASAETSRVTVEAGRVSAESGRVATESARGTAESGRVTAEQARVSAEAARAAFYNGFNAKISSIESQQYFPVGFKPKYYNTKPGRTIEDFETDTQWVGGSATITANTSEVKFGSKSVKATLGSAGGTGNMTKTITGYFGNAVRPLKLWIYCHGDPATVLSSLSIYLASTTDFSKYMMRELTPQIITEGWNQITINLFSGWTYSGGESLGNMMVRMRFSFVAKTGQNLALTFDGLEGEAESSPRILFVFDDGLTSVHDVAYPIMEAAGFKGVSYVVGNSIGGAGNMTLAQLQALYDDGWDIGNHSQEHLDQSEMTLEQVEYQIETCQNALLGYGFTRSAKHYALPFGIYNATIAQAIANVGVTTVRSSVGSIFYPEAVSVLKLPSKAAINTTTLATVIGWVEEAIVGGKTLILMFHMIATTASTEYIWSTANFQSLVNYIKYKNVPVVTMSEWYSGLNLL